MKNAEIIGFCSGPLSHSGSVFLSVVRLNRSALLAECIHSFPLLNKIQEIFFVLTNLSIDNEKGKKIFCGKKRRQPLFVSFIIEWVAHSTSFFQKISHDSSSNSEVFNFQNFYFKMY